LRQKFLFAISEHRYFNRRSHADKQRLAISIAHKREDDGPRSTDTPDPKNGKKDKNYLLRFGVGD
jgi:hypothetical protein